MPGLWSVVKSWINGEVLTHTDLNAEFQNVITNQVPAQFDDYSSSVAQMQTNTDPGEVGSESQATTLAGELERERFAIKEIKGTDQWYETAKTSLSLLSQPDQGLHIGIEFDGKNGGASTTTDALAKLINQGGIINAASLSSADVVIGDFDSTNVKFNTYSLALDGSTLVAFEGTHGNPFKGSISLWFRNLAAAAGGILYNPLLGLELLLESAGGTLEWTVTERTAATESTKDTTTVTGSSSRAADTTFRNVTAKWRLNDENGASTDLMEMEYEGSDEGTQIGSDDIDINPGLGGTWFAGVSRNDPSWDHFYAASGLPTAHSDAWTANGTTASNAVANGVLTISGQTGVQTNNYSKTNNIDLSQFTAEWKAILNSGSRLAINDSSCTFVVRDDSMDRSLFVNINPGSISIFTETTTPVHLADILLDTSQYHVYRLTSSGSPSPTMTLYIDGQNVWSESVTTSDTTAGDTVTFGDTSATSGGNSNAGWEFVKYFDAGATAPLTLATQGNLDSLGVSSSIISDVTVTALQSSRVTDVFGSEPSHGPTLPLEAYFARNGSVSTASATFVDMSTFVYYVAGDGISEYLFDIQASLNNGTTAERNSYIAVDIDNDVTGLAVGVNSIPWLLESGASTIGNHYAVSFSRSAILTPGLHEVRPQFAVDAADTLNLNEENSQFSMTLRKLKKL